MNPQSSGALPILVSLLICDQVIDDRMTNKKSAIGLFNTIFATSFPSRLQQVSVMATLTEIGRATPLELRLVRDSDNEVLMNTQGSVQAPSPLAMVDLVFSLHGARLDGPGQYAFELLSDEQILGRRRFQAVHRPQPNPDREQPPTLNN
jgi:hypothetical protein